MSDTEHTRLAVVGAEGAVGREVISILLDRGHSPRSIVALGSERSGGRVLEFGVQRVNVQPYTPNHVAGCSGAILCTSDKVSERIAPELAELGVFVVDNSSHFRMHPDVPLVIPAINGSLLSADPRPLIVANPNCSTIMLLTALDPIKRAFGIDSVVVSTYQAVSGAGAPAIKELYTEAWQALKGESPDPSVFPVSCAFNVFPHESERDESGYCGEERKMISESRRIWNDQGFDLFPTCIRVPVERAHAQSIVFQTSVPTHASPITDVLRSAPNIQLHSDFALTPLDIARTNQVHIAPVRMAEIESNRKFAIWTCCDQLRRGAAVNALECLSLYGVST